jgi:hypothetical protein
MKRKIEPTNGEWSAGVYNTTETMVERLKHKPQSCVCVVEHGMPGMVVALCGDADDVQSQRDADLMSAAKEMFAALEANERAIGAGIEADPELWSDAALKTQAALKKARGTHG